MPEATLRPMTIVQDRWWDTRHLSRSEDETVWTPPGTETGKRTDAVLIFEMHGFPAIKKRKYLIVKKK